MKTRSGRVLGRQQAVKPKVVPEEFLTYMMKRGKVEKSDKQKVIDLIELFLHPFFTSNPQDLRRPLRQDEDPRSETIRTLYFKFIEERIGYCKKMVSYYGNLSRVGIRGKMMRFRVEADDLISLLPRDYEED